MNKKTILEINYRLVFENQENYVQYLEQTKHSQPELYNEILNSEYKNTSSKLVVDGELAKRTRTTIVYEIGLA